MVTGCPYDCGGSCPLHVYLEEGRVVRLAPEEGPDSPESPRLRPCAKGLAHLQRIYHPDRLLHPLKRLGERGEGSFQRISWEEALDTVAGEMRRVKESYGPQAILNLRGAGNTDGLLHRTNGLINRFFNGFGGQTATRASISYEGALFAGRATFGFAPPPPGPESLSDSKLVIMWGFNPAETVFGTNTNWYLALAKERGVKFIFVDPRFTDSAAALADQWIPIRPGTDTAMLVAMAFVLSEEHLYDEAFLRRYSYGFERFQDYLLGVEDGIPKSTTWAEALCGVRAEVIADLAREYAASKPADLRGGWSPGRTAYGEQFHRACAVLSALTGNAGIPGGGPGCWTSQDFQHTLGVSALPSLGNPVHTSIVAWKWPEAVLQGTAGGYPSDIKMIYSIGGNRLNQCPDVSKGIRALKKVEFVVAQEQFMTPMARFADILLPVNTHFEREDVQVPHNLGHYLIYNRKVIESLGESRSDLEILTALAERLGIPGFGDRTEEDWLRELTKGAAVDYDILRDRGVCRFEPPFPPSPLEEFIADPKGHPLPTPSGKIEIFSQVVAQRSDPQLPPVPQYLEHRAGPRAAGSYPLLLISIHSKKSVHSTFDNVPWMRELEPHALMLNSADAGTRGISSGQQVVVYNDVGTIIVEARLTERLMPGVVALNEGAWFRFDERGRDRGGCANVLCPDIISPAEAAATNGVPVEVAGWEG